MIFSIITITKNNLDGFIKTHKSLMAQSFQEFEWIIADGGSIDGTIEYVNAHELNQFFVSGKDTGIYNAMNKGIDRAAGDYLLFLNAGDVLADADILSTISKVIAAYAPDFIYGDALEENITLPHPFYKKAKSHSQILHGMFTHHQAMVYRRTLMENLRYNEGYKIASDYEFTVQFLKKAQNIHYIPCSLCVFEQGGISQKQRRLGRVEQYRIRRDLNLCSMWVAWGIYRLQTLASYIKAYFPWLFHYLKTKK